MMITKQQQLMNFFIIGPQNPVDDPIFLTLIICCLLFPFLHSVLGVRSLCVELLIIYYLTPYLTWTDYERNYSRET